MYFNKTNITSGVNLTYIDTDKIKSDELFINFIMPLTLETATYYNLIARILNRGTQSFATLKDISVRLDDLYNAHAAASVMKKGEHMIISFSLSAMRKAYTFDGEDVFRGTFELLSEIIFKPLLVDGAFSPEYFKSESDLLTDAIRSAINNKTTYAIKRCTEIMCEGEPYSISALGDLDVLSTITPQKLYDCYKNMLEVMPVEILFAGKIPHDEVVGYINELLPLKPRGGFDTTVASPLAPQVKKIEEKLDVTQGKLCIGFRAITLGDKDHTAYALFNELFGGGMTSKLFVNVREKQSLCYFCQSVPDPLKGVMYVVSGIDFDSYDKASEGIFKELSDIKNGKITQNEFDNARKSLINAYHEIPDTPSKLCAWYLNRILVGREDSPLDAAMAVERLTIDDVVEVANRITLDTVYFLRG